jgi:hypothetical protein
VPDLRALHKYCHQILRAATGFGIIPAATYFRKRSTFALGRGNSAAAFIFRATPDPGIGNAKFPALIRALCLKPRPALAGKELGDHFRETVPILSSDPHGTACSLASLATCCRECHACPSWNGYASWLHTTRVWLTLLLEMICATGC